MVEGGSEKAFAQWLAERPQSFCEKVEAVAMDAFAGYKKAAARQVPHAVEILDPFHIVKLAGDKVTAVRCRLQREATGRRGTSVFCQVGVGRFGVSFSPCERRVSGRFGVGRSCWLLVIALVIA